MENKHKVVQLIRTCFACPSQWEGKLENGDNLYVRYRWGRLRIEINDEIVFSKQLHIETEEEVKAYYDNLRNTLPADRAEQLIESDKQIRKLCADAGEPLQSYNGMLEYTELKEATADMFDWPETDGE